MRIFQIYKLSIFYNLFNLLRYTAQYIEDKIKIGDILYGEFFIGLLQKYLNVKIQEDWIGRLYGVINPMINFKGQLDVNNMIIELDGENTNNKEYLKTWIYKQLNLIGDLFKLHGLYDYIDLEIKHVGPMNADNYLIVFDIVSRKYLLKFIKRTILQIIIYALIITGIILFVL